jgi:hypothetical protein
MIVMIVMAGLDPAIHVLLVASLYDVDARHKAGPDGAEKSTVNPNDAATN